MGLSPHWAWTGCRKLSPLFILRKRTGEVGNWIPDESTFRLPIFARAKFICGFQHSRYARDLSALYALYVLDYTQLPSLGGIAGGPGSQMSLAAVAIYASFLQPKDERGRT
jgi:hypothetical protein